ncbi:MAG: transposase zinc-binding domain-containing protein [Akkermansiaceae bacterium]|nr:transposase zinc-binding domain-containing protein [Akkermansiaceae bacterium]
MPAIFHPRRPRASPLWQIVTAAWEAFVAGYEKVHRAAMGPLRANAFAVVGAFLRCGDLAYGFLRLRCPDCGDEHLLAFTCKGRHFCPSCHQRRVRHLSAWIATSVCHEVPHRQFVFTIPRVLRGIFRIRRDLLHLLFQTATDTLPKTQDGKTQDSRQELACAKAVL